MTTTSTPHLLPRIVQVLDALVERRAAEHARGGADVTCRNALFMGDTNWDESTDGEVPLPHGWSDAWATHGGAGLGAQLSRADPLPVLIPKP
jgi:hypothetical protein